jgi:hypothetical protein
MLKINDNSSEKNKLYLSFVMDSDFNVMTWRTVLKESPLLVTAGSKEFELRSGDMFGKILIMQLVTKGNQNALTCLQLLSQNSSASAYTDRAYFISCCGCTLAT